MFTGSDAMYCVCKSDANPVAMQKAIDYACGKGADCTQITSSGPCFQPSSVVAHCSYACNSYYQKNAGMGATCDFMGVATLTGADPSAGSCKYPASASGAGTGGMGTGGTGTGTGPSMNQDYSAAVVGRRVAAAGLLVAAAAPLLLHFI
ncbi:unnamed protein product [Triticum turgidum subsp. durum]|uniref:X8 domain-containing protein n=1 Tax=Triticum turgidum subsp. durum TaxID=4567 RepID=A0A9R0VA05_TRITD|nr:unnamed protein product [Triticum turgidum subsp. durum]